jgi:hypothetical protein
MNEAAPAPDNAACPRCGGSFRCGVADKVCDCFGAQLNDALRQQLAADYSSCLCMACLTELRLQQAATPRR